MVQLARERAIEWTAVIVAGFAVLIAILGIVISSFAGAYSVLSAHQANTTANRLRDDIEIYYVRAGKLEYWLEAHGVPVEEITGGPLPKPRED